MVTEKWQQNNKTETTQICSPKGKDCVGVMKKKESKVGRYSTLQLGLMEKQKREMVVLWLEYPLQLHYLHLSAANIMTPHSQSTHQRRAMTPVLNINILNKIIARANIPAQRNQYQYKTSPFNALGVK